MSMNEGKVRREVEFSGGILKTMAGIKVEKVSGTRRS